MIKRRLVAVASLALASVLAFSACSSAPATTGTTSAAAAAEASASASSTDYYPVTVTDMAGNKVTIESADSVAVTDNRFFQLAADWAVPVTVAPLELFSTNNPLKTDAAILNIGTHGEPDFEKVVAADPDLIINGYRFAGDNAQKMKDAAPTAAFIDMTGDENLTVDEYTVQSITLMGEVFNKKAEAQALIDSFHTAVDDAKAAYDPKTTVLGLLTSGGEINFANPVDGRGAGIFFPLLALTPALDLGGSENHTGDSVSIEMLAQSNADVLLVLDRDAAVGEGEVKPALEVINGSTALAAVPAVVNQKIVVMPADYYLTEDVFAYITVVEGLTEVFKAQ